MIDGGMRSVCPRRGTKHHILADWDQAGHESLLLGGQLGLSRLKAAPIIRGDNVEFVQKLGRRGSSHVANTG